MNNQDFIKLIEKITDGTASEEEVRAYQAYYNLFQHKDSSIDDEKIKSHIWHNILRKINYPINRVFNFRTYWAAASILLLLSVVAVVGVKLLQSSTTENIAFIEKNNKAGVRTKFILPDGSKVTLNGESSLKFSEQFTGKVRELYLTGEAFFEVVHKKDTAFIVHAGNITTTDVGTSFNIAAYNKESNVVVTVASGIVQVNAKNKNFGTLIVNHRLTYSATSNKSTIEKVDAAKIFAWTKGHLIFDGETFDEVATSIKRIYNIDIQLNDKIRNCAIHAAISDKDVEQNIKLIAETMNAKVQKTAAGGYIIIGGRCL